MVQNANKIHLVVGYPEWPYFEKPLLIDLKWLGCKQKVVYILIPYHFLFTCPLYAQIRVVMLDSISHIKPDIAPGLPLLL